MAIGFGAQDFSLVVGWNLYQVTLDKYHLMFLFNEGHDLLNVAHRCSYRSEDGKIAYDYEIYGDRKFINVDRILRKSIVSYRVHSKEELQLRFENDDVLSVFDDAKFRSWWFLCRSRRSPD